MAKATPAAIALYGKTRAFEMSRVPCIERYSQFIAPLGTKRPLISLVRISCIFLLLTYALHYPGVSVLPRASINLLNVKNAQNNKNIGRIKSGG